MSEIIFGTPEHVAWFLYKALEADFRRVNDRRMELENECERLENECECLDTENAELRRLAHDIMCFYRYKLSPEDRKQREAELFERVRKLGVIGEEYIGMEVDE